MRILLATADRRFRTVASSLLERHGYKVATAASAEAAFTSVERQRPQIAVLDAGRSPTATPATIAQLLQLAPRVAFVVVADEPRPDLAGFEVLPKWDPFDGFLHALEDAHRGRPDCAAVVLQV